MRNIILKLQEGVFVYGLYLDGAGWDKRRARLAESINKVLYTMIPVVRIFAVYQINPITPSHYVVSLLIRKYKTKILKVYRNLTIRYISNHGKKYA